MWERNVANVVEHKIDAKQWHVIKSSNIILQLKKKSKKRKVKSIAQ
jgi:hypothetical protein